MVIAVYAGRQRAEDSVDFSFWMEDVIQLLALQYPEHRFYFISESPQKNSSAIHQVTLKIPAGYSILQQLMLQRKLSRLLRDKAAEVFVDGYGLFRCSVPQCLLIPSEYLDDNRNFWRGGWFHRWKMRSIIKKARSIAVFSEVQRQQLMSLPHSEDATITLVPLSAAAIFQPLPHEQCATVKDKFTGGLEYFFAAGSSNPADTITLLKAFSIFKKRQKSSMKLVLQGYSGNNKTEEVLKTYRFRDDVITAYETDQHHLAQLTAAAYAAVDLSRSGIPLQLMQAMAVAVPQITTSSDLKKEIAGDAALYFNPGEITELAEQLMLVYKDESLRSRLITSACRRSQQHTLENSARILGQCIGLAVKV